LEILKVPTRHRVDFIVVGGVSAVLDGASVTTLINASGRYNQKNQMGEPAIVVDPDVMSGTPCFRGTRVPFKNLIDYLEGGHPLGEFLRQFPTVSRELTVQSLEEAKDSLLARIA
jgi:uncharacterized protein (DUF433 family)